MNYKFMFDRYYCINSAETKEIMVYYISQPRHIFIRVKAFVFMLVPEVLQFLSISTSFEWRPFMSISKKVKVNGEIREKFPLHKPRGG